MYKLDNCFVFQLCGDRDNPSISMNEQIAFCLPANPMSDRGQAIVIVIDTDNNGTRAER